MYIIPCRIYACIASLVFSYFTSMILYMLEHFTIISKMLHFVHKVNRRTIFGFTSTNAVYLFTKWLVFNMLYKKRVGRVPTNKYQISCFVKKCVRLMFIRYNPNLHKDYIIVPCLLAIFILLLAS